MRATPDPSVAGRDHPFALSVGAQRRGRSAHLRSLAAALVALTASACSANFTPRSVLNDLRVLALVASPIEAGPTDAVTVAPFVVPPPQALIVDERWTFCPLSAGSSAGYACAVPACEVELAAPAGGSVTATPGALALDCVTRLSAAGALPAGVPSALPDQVTTLFRYVVTASDGERREAVQLVPLYPRGAPVNRNSAPVITGVFIGGRALETGGLAPDLAPGHDLVLHVLIDPASAQTYVDSAGITLTESMVVSFYTTAGRFDYDRANGPDASVTLQYQDIDASQSEAVVWIVARDLRGGETVAGPYRVPITH